MPIYVKGCYFYVICYTYVDIIYVLEEMYSRTFADNIFICVWSSAWFYQLLSDSITCNL